MRRPAGRPGQEPRQNVAGPSGRTARVIVDGAGAPQPAAGNRAPGPVNGPAPSSGNVAGPHASQDAISIRERAKAGLKRQAPEADDMSQPQRARARKDSQETIPAASNAQDRLRQKRG